MMRTHLTSWSLRIQTVMVTVLIAAAPVLFLWVSDVDADAFPLVKLTVIVGLMAVLMGLWLGRTWVQPIAHLREEALERVQRPLHAPPLKTGEHTEFAGLALAFNTLLSSVRDQASSNERFVADLAHEMKNPIAALRAVGESLEDGPDLTPERAQRLARVIHSSSRGLDGLVTGLLELARAEAGLTHASREVFDIAALVTGVVANTALDERFADIEFIPPCSEPIHLFGVPSQLETAVRNVVLNAASFAGAGRVEVSMSVADESVAITVHDSGPGIPEANLPHVFDRFYTSRAGQAGTGLGLALVNAIVQAHGGQASALSTPDSGATIRLVLPIHTTFTPVS
jgi:signal transduction histidine kinase